MAIKGTVINLVMLTGIKIIIRGSVLGRLLMHSAQSPFFYSNDPKRIPAKYWTPDNSENCSEKSSTSINKFTIVDFDDDLELESPLNWPVWVKVLISINLALMSATVYISSVIYMPAKEKLIEEFEITETQAILPLTLFVIAYGFGPLIFSPLSEHPAIGRSIQYVIPLSIFVLLQIPLSLVRNFAAFCFLRFLSGLMISPVLATGGASFADMFKGPYLPAFMSMWGIGAFIGVSLGPLIGSVLVVKTDGWRWSMWTLMIVGGFLLMLFTAFVPETYERAILFQKAKRLRNITKNDNIVSEVNDESYGFSAANIKEILWRPVAITLSEPVVLLINIYLGVLYAIVYLWFEGLPIVFNQVHHFSTVASGASYLPIIPGVLCGSVLYSVMLYFSYSKPIQKGEKVSPEAFTPVGIVGSAILPISLFLAGWTSTSTIHWIVPMIGIFLFGMSGIIIFQSLLNYVAMCFPRYVASAFASNAFARSVFAGSFPLFGVYLFENTGSEKWPIGGGSSILGGISLLLVAVTVGFHFWGHKLRSASKYAN